jgi:DNA-binding response OmpR family regulator
MSRILIIEDEQQLCRALCDNFAFEGYEVIVAGDGASGYSKATAEKPDVVILDLMLPRMSGYDVCRKLRADGVNTPILMLTARGEEADRIAGLDLGADDYVTKPFSLGELGARVRALLRRAGRLRAMPDKLQLEGIVIDFAAYEAHKDGIPLELTRKEFQLLRLLAARSGQAVTRDELLIEVWGEETYVTNRTVDTHVANLRAKIERDPRHPRRLLTVHGIGYRWDEQNSTKT